MSGHYPSSLSPSLPLLPVTLSFKAAKHFSLKNSLRPRRAVGSLVHCVTCWCLGKWVTWELKLSTEERMVIRSYSYEQLW